MPCASRRDGSDLKRMKAKIKSGRSLNLGGAAERAAIRDWKPSVRHCGPRRSAAEPRTAGGAAAPGSAAADRRHFERRLAATLTGGKATRDGMRLISGATRDLIKGGAIRIRPKNRTMTGRV